MSGPTIASAFNSQARHREPAQGPQCPEDLVGLRLVLAVGAQPLPEERRSIEPEHVDPPVAERHRSTPSMARKTAGLAQFRSHWNSWNVVHTHSSVASRWVKLPGAMSGNTSGSVRS